MNATIISGTLDKTNNRALYTIELPDGHYIGQKLAVFAADDPRLKRLLSDDDVGLIERLKPEDMKGLLSGLPVWLGENRIEPLVDKYGRVAGFRVWRQHRIEEDAAS